MKDRTRNSRHAPLSHQHPLKCHDHRVKHQPSTEHQDAAETALAAMKNEASIQIIRSYASIQQGRCNETIAALIMASYLQPLNSVDVAWHDFVCGDVAGEQLWNL